MKRTVLLIVMLLASAASFVTAGNNGTVSASAVTQPLIVSNVDELNAAENTAKQGNLTILLHDGTYELSDQFVVHAAHVTIKSLNGDASKVIVRGNGMNGNVPHIFSVHNDHFTVEDLTLGWVKNHGIQVHGEMDADHFTARNVHFTDTGEQMLKVSAAQDQTGFSDNGLVEGCTFAYTAGVGPQWYIGGVDAHRAKGWIIRNNLFLDIKSPSSTLAESAVHFWSDSTDTVVENNRIIDCDRGVMFGLDNNHHYGGFVRNNFIHVTRDVGIYLANAQGAAVYNNTVFVGSGYMNAIEYRFADTQAYIINNLTNRPITSRDGGSATLSHNVETALDSWFLDPFNGDLHLSNPVFSVVDQAMDVDLPYDIDGDVRLKGSPDIGADETGFVIKPVAQVVTQTDKVQILSNGKDAVQVLTLAVYQDGSQAYVSPDTIRVTDSTGNHDFLSTPLFTSFTAGDYTITCAVNGIESSGVKVTVKQEDLTQAQVSGIALKHRDGQTFVTFNEIVQLISDPAVHYDDLYGILGAYTHTIEYRIYVSDAPITAAGLDQMAPVGVVAPLSGWNLGIYGKDTNTTSQQAFRYVIEDNGPPLGVSQGLFVYNPPQPGTAWYAVTAVVDGVENKTIVQGENTAAVQGETVGQGTPVLQGSGYADTIFFVDDVQLFLYTRWESPPNSSVMGQPHDYLVGKPSNMAVPAPVGIHMHCWGGNLISCYAWWNDAEDGALLLASNQSPYDWWTGYHEKYYDKGASSKDWAQSGVVRPYTTTRLISFLDWMDASPAWTVDLTRTFTAGVSMGGSGALMMAIRYPELISWSRSWVGVHVPEKSPVFKGSYEEVYGKPGQGVLFEGNTPDDGTPVWDYYNNVWYLENHVAQGIGFLSFSNGKNDGSIGWEQAVDFVDALQKTRQPHLFIWGQGGHDERTVLPKNGSERHMAIDVRTDQSLPAFTNCTLDDNYGNGNPADGDSSGQVNKYLYWETDDLTDTPNTWEITLALMDSAPQASCKVDLTPRRLQQFLVTPGETLSFENIDTTGNTVIHSGSITADSYGLVTIPQTVVSKTGNRIVVSRSVP